MKKFLVKIKNRYKPKNIKARFKKRIRQPLWWSTIIFAFLAFFFFFCLCVISDDYVNMKNGLERIGYRLNQETKTIEEIPTSDSSTEESSSSSSSTEEDSSSTESSSSSSTKPEKIVENSETKEEEPKKEDSKVPTEYKNALKSAEQYLDYSYFSKKGLYDQLTSEYGDKYPAEAAQYAVDNVKADWNEQALKAAKNYQKTTPMSNEGLRDQLTSEYGERFTPEEAQYAIDHLEK